MSIRPHQITAAAVELQRLQHYETKVVHSLLNSVHTNVAF
jgi:hypothetical protein